MARKKYHCTNCGNAVYRDRAFGNWQHRMTGGSTCFDYQLRKGEKVTEVEER